MSDLIERIERMSVPEPNTGCCRRKAKEARELKALEQLVSAVA